MASTRAVKKGLRIRLWCLIDWRTARLCCLYEQYLPIWDRAEEELEELRHDSRVVEVLTEHGIASPAKIKALPKPERDDLLGDLRARGFSIRELERLTGIGRGVIQRL